MAVAQDTNQDPQAESSQDAGVAADTVGEAAGPAKKAQRQARRRPRPTAEDTVPGGAPPAMPAPGANEFETLPTATSILRLKAGLYALEVVADDESAQPDLSPVWLAQAPSSRPQSVDMLSASGVGDQWLSGAEKIVAVRAPREGIVLTATRFGVVDRPPAPPQLIVRALEAGLPATERAPAPPPVASPMPLAQPVELAPAPEVTGEREIPLEVAVHIERVGDRTFGGAIWAGQPGEQRRVEGFSIKPLLELQPNEVEYKALHPGGVETPWISGPQFCGTRGRSLPITGLAIRIAPHVQDQFSVVYQAAFFRSGITEQRRDGAPCLPRLPGDALEGVNIRITQRRA